MKYNLRYTTSSMIYFVNDLLKPADQKVSDKL